MKMIRGTTTTSSTMLHYRERIAVWLRCESVAREKFSGSAIIRLKLGDEERAGRVGLDSVHGDMVLCYADGEILGGPRHGWMVLEFLQPLQDERFRISAPEEQLEAICVKTEVLVRPVSTPPGTEEGRGEGEDQQE